MNTEQPMLVFEKWYKSLRFVSVNSGPANGTIAAALVVIERLKETYDLDIESHLAPGGTQVKGVSGTAVAVILKSFGETRPFAKEGGRTNRGAASEIKSLLAALSTLHLKDFSFEKRNEHLTAFQRYLVNRIIDYHNRQKIKFIFDSQLSTWQNISNLLEAAAQEGKTGYVAQHLIGAKLKLRFPNIEISNESASTADQQTNRSGDFLIGDTVFHITVAPMQGVFKKCEQNIADGFKVYLLVPDSKLIWSRSIAKEVLKNQIAVESIESFVAQNIEEMSAFKSDKLKYQLVAFIEIYNQRIDAVEIDKSLMIELPANLQKKQG
ncbi:MAG TPA: DUF4928 family protein [Saprospiraceae bacterium]|nr:DUF4928 family protein [Saprospiraceae bacterium]HMP22729.1 DUF4928 family protein [Saprospiraceae bacterium]